LDRCHNLLWTYRLFKSPDRSRPFYDAMSHILCDAISIKY